MERFTVEKTYSGKRIDNYILKVLPDFSYSLLQKIFRKKDVKLNGKRVKKDAIVHEGDVVEIYIPRPTGAPDGHEMSSASLRSHDAAKNMYTVIYEDSNVIIVNKKQGISVHPDRENSSVTLIDSLEQYLGFRPHLCHRLDRNTGGLIIVAKSKEILEIIIDLMNSGKIRKYYKCLVKGKMDSQDGILKGWLVKDRLQSRVFISEKRRGNAHEVITKYRMLKYMEQADISLLEVELVTGRTHQIRAHLANTGHPVLGDGKYGLNSINKPLGLKYQQLWAYKLEFVFGNKDAALLNYLDGKVFQVEPEFSISL